MTNNIEDSIRYAIEQSPIVPPTTIPESLRFQGSELVETTATSTFEDLRYEPDGCGVLWDPNSHSPHTVLAPSAHEFYEVFDIFAGIAAKDFKTNYTPGFRQLLVKHELGHAAAQRRLGAKAVAYALSIFRCVNNDGVVVRIGTQLSVGPSETFATTKLGIAVATAFPEAPSPGDKADMQALGYEGRADIVKRAIDYNNVHKGGPQYPIPD